jgi:hypothetical protein
MRVIAAPVLPVIEFMDELVGMGELRRLDDLGFGGVET